MQLIGLAGAYDWVLLQPIVPDISAKYPGRAITVQSLSDFIFSVFVGAS